MLRPSHPIPSHLILPHLNSSFYLTPPHHIAPHLTSPHSTSFAICQTSVVFDHPPRPSHFFSKGTKAPTKYADTRYVVRFCSPLAHPVKTSPNHALYSLQYAARHKATAMPTSLFVAPFSSHPIPPHLTSPHLISSHLIVPYLLTSPRLISLKFARPTLFLITHQQPPPSHFLSKGVKASTKYVDTRYAVSFCPPLAYPVKTSPNHALYSLHHAVPSHLTPSHHSIPSHLTRRHVCVGPPPWLFFIMLSMIKRNSVCSKIPGAKNVPSCE